MSNLIYGLAVGVGVVGTDVAYAENLTKSPDAELEFLDGDSIELTVLSDSATTSVMVRNKGSVDLTNPTFRLLLADGDTNLGLLLVDPSDLTIAAHTVRAVELEGKYPDDAPLRPGVLSVASGETVMAATPIDVVGEASVPNVIITILGGVFIATVAVWLGGRHYRNRLREPLAKEASWEFGKSWAANFTAIGALLATVLGASEIVEEALPGVPLAQFVGLNVFFGGVSLFAPIVFSALQVRRDAGSIGGFLLASFLTLMAVSGQLLTIVRFFGASSRGTFGGGTLMTMIGAVVVLFTVVSYGRRSIEWRLTEAAPDAGATVERPIVLV